MSIFADILKGLPANPVLREKLSAAEAKQAELETENAILKDDLRKANTEIANLKRRVEELRHADDIDEIELRLLNQIAHLDYDNAFAENIAHGLELSPARVDYHIQRLEDWGYVECGLVDDFGPHYSPTQEGRALLLKKNLL